VALGKVRRKHGSGTHNARQGSTRQARHLEPVADGFDGTRTTTKWAKIEKCSHDAALRDIQDLIEHGLLKKNPGGGRSTSISLNDV